MRTVQWILYVAVLGAFFTISACLSHSSGRIETGLASWYGKPFHTKPTASGEPFDMYAMTAAHPSLPFGTKVRVSHAASGISVIVRINDRGPFNKKRIIDLSYAAAKKLDFLSEGTAQVTVEVLL